MLRISLLIILCMGVMMLNAQRECDFVHETVIEFSEFTNVKLEGNIDIFFTQSENNSILMKTLQEEHINDVHYSFGENTLNIRNEIREDRSNRERRRGRRRNLVNVNVGVNGANNVKILVYIETSNIESFLHRGAGSITFLGDVDVEKLTFRIEGVANIEIPKLSVNDFDIQVNGVSNAKITGKADHIKVRSNGVGRLNLKDIVATTADVSVNGVGTVNIHSTEELSVAINGVGTVVYYGDPQIKSKSVGFLGVFRRGRG